MKKLINKISTLILTVVLLFASISMASVKAFEVEESLRLAVISDLHYYPVSYTGNNNVEYQKFAKGHMRLVGENSAATESAVKMILQDNPEVVLVTGDLTHNGEKQSAIELASTLQKLVDRGIKVYVINGNHDINSDETYSFESGKKEKVDNISPTEFRQIFKNFGYNGADDAVYYQNLNTKDNDFIQGGMSYIVTPKPGYKILMLDSEVYTSDYLGKSKGMISPELLQWAVSQLNEAQANGEIVVGGMHHPLLTHYGNNFSSLSIGMSLQIFEMIDNNKIAADQLANANLKYIFTGHMHGNDIAEYTSRKGNKLIDIETGAIGALGAPVRQVEVSKEGISIASKSVEKITWFGEEIDYQDYLIDQVYNHDIFVDVLDQALIGSLEETLQGQTLYDLVQGFSGIEVKPSLEKAIIGALSETMEVDASVGKMKINLNMKNPKDPIIHMWGTGGLGLLPDYDISIRNNIFVGLDDLMITQFNALWLTKDVNGQTRLNKAIKQVIKDIESMPVHDNGKTLHDLAVESIKSSTLGNEVAPQWVEESIGDFKIKLSRRMAKEYLIPSLKRNIINPLLDEMYLDINKTFPSKSIYRDALGYILGGSFGKQKIPLRDLLTNLGKVDVDKEIDDLVRKHVDNDSDISMLGNPIANILSSQWTDSLGKDDEINGEAVWYTIADADPNAVAEVEYKNIHLGVGSDQSETFVTWYSTSAMDGRVQIALKEDMIDGKLMPTDLSKIQEVSAQIETTIESEFTSNKATLSGLKENTDYVYRVGNEGDWSDLIHFRTSTFGNSWGFVFAADAQLGSTGSIPDDESGWYSSLELITEKHPESSFILHVGDQVEHADSTEQYDSFLGHDITKRYRLSTLVGNHDDGNFAYSEHFQNPNVQNDSGTSKTGKEAGNYWFVYNNALFISLNANNKNYDEHVKFLRETMQNQSKKTTWQIVTYHQSTYSAANHSEDPSLISLRNTISPVMSELGIDAVLMGHDHSYVRTYMMDGTTPQKTDSVEYSVTDPENNLVLYVTGNSPASKHYSLKGNQQWYAAVRNQEGLNNISYVDMSDNHLRVTTYRTEESDLVPFKTHDEMTVVDEFTIYKTNNSPTQSAPTLNVPQDITLTREEYETFDFKQGVEARSFEGKNLNDFISIDGDIDVNQDGVYKLTYSITHNEMITTAIRFVTIIGNSFDVHFDSKGAMDVAPQLNVKPNSLINEPLQPILEHHNFEGWFYKDTKWNFESHTIQEDMTLEAKWSLKEYTISFSNDGETIKPLKVRALSTIKNLPTPQWDTYEFVGWYLDSELTIPWKEEVEVIESLTLYAKWIDIQQSLVVFDPTNGEDINLVPTENGSLIQEPVIPTRDGYRFAGWNTQRDGLGKNWDFSTDKVGVDELFLYAQWEFESITVTFDSMGGNLIKPVSLYHGGQLTEIEIPIKSGSKFEGWFYDKQYENIFNQEEAITQSITLYAKWNTSQLQVTFDTQGGSSVADQWIDVNGTVQVPNEPKREGFNFLGWYLNDEQYDFINPITEDIILIAKWEKKETDRIEITFDTNGGSEIPSTLIDKNSLLSKPANPVKTGFKFVGWYQDSEFVNEFNFGEEVTEEITLYAKWKIIDYTVSFETNGGTRVENQIVSYSEVLNKPINPQKTGHNFIGWYLDKELSKPLDFAMKITSNIEVYAKWDAIQYIITFESNGGSSVANQLVRFNGMVIQPQVPVRPGYHFMGWFVGENQYDFTSNVTHELELTAVWEKNTVPDTPEGTPGETLPGTGLSDNITPFLAVLTIIAGFLLLIISKIQKYRKQN